ncbi:MAG: Fatty acid desaturase (EC; Delta-9 fatty acid desaturase (EC [uncultured Thiotrichaceae bacterium]|uniref:Fatty acid desaturase ) n=1 Tax=uncultured Thiotrichaceae bacterium TaxID=298394 RepID=A0A6S6TJH0_9GAMM|nr:MAG: Fatty acid desaturase (EC; Delta-9 fatty acid desaturase (EC [uncultured Thiotrichaceae bacterium]
MNPSASKKPGLIWLNVLVFTSTFAIAAIGVPLYAYFVGFELSTIIAAILAIGFCGLSITAGYHRLWSHKAYEANVVVRFLFAIGGAFALQNSILHWSSDHRTHHRFVDDNEKDPYSANRGFWYSHIGWMLREYYPQDYNDYHNVRDLKRDKIVMWQHNNYLLLALLTNFGIPVVFGLITGQFWASILLVGFLRLVVSHHVTFLINSLAHMWGTQPYNDQNTAKDNPIVALLTYGEGYHNYHHAFAFDYRNAIKWWQFDPTKWLIKSLSLVGLAKNLRKTPEERINKAIAKLQRNKTCEKLNTLSIPNKEEALLLIHQEYDELLHAMNTFYEAKKEWLEVTKDKLIDNVEKSQQAKRYRELKQSWTEQQKHWQLLIHQYA